MGIALPQLAPASEDRVSGAQVIDGSLKFIRSNSNVLKRTPSTVGNRRTFTWSVWVKRSNLSVQMGLLSTYASTHPSTALILFADGSLQVQDYPSSSYQMRLLTNMRLRDPSAFYHIVVSVDTTQSTDSNRAKVYVNGEQVTSFSTANYGSQYVQTDWNNTTEHNIGRHDQYLEGHLSNVYCIDGAALGPENFGYTDLLTNTWRPKKFSAFNNPNNGTTWTNSISGTEESGWVKSQTFDGTGASSRASNGNSLTFTPSSAIPIKTSLRINARRYGSGSSQMTVNGTNYTSLLSATKAYVTIPESTITSIVWSNVNGNSDSVDITTIEVDGFALLDGAEDNSFYLPFDGNSPIGKDKSNKTYTNQINDGTAWSSSVSGPTSGSPYNIERAFDGNLTTYGDHSGQNTTWTFTRTFTSVTSLRVYIHGGNSTNTVTTVGGNGTQTDTISTDFGPGWHNIALGTTGSTINSIAFTRGGSGNPLSVYAIEVNNTVLVNGNSWAPDNFGGSAALDKATGAKPILNTLPDGTVARPGVFGSEENLFYTVTTANGSVYQFDITSGDNPSLSFIRGATYKFDYSSHTGHPLLFSTSNPDSSVSAYTDGTSIASNVISFTVPHNAPATLYYYCSNHPTGMNGAISITTDETKADPYAWKNVLALPLVGNANDVSNSIACTSTTKSTTVSGAIANYTYSNFYRGSYYFDGSNDYISAADSTDYDFGTADFTTEVWFYATSISGDQYIMNFNGGAANAAHNGINIYNGNWRIGGFNNYLIEGNVGLVANKWTHVAISRESGILRVFVDGSKIGETSANVSFDSTSAIFFGSNTGGSLNFGPGYMQDARVYRGVAKYTSNFIPASTNPDILPDTPSGVSGSSKLTKITDGAVHFDGSGDSLASSDSADLAFGTGEFTVEMFFYANTVSGNDVLYDSRAATGGPSDGFSIVRNGDELKTYTSGAYKITPSTFRVASYRWYHLAITRESTTQKMYIDGVLVGSATVSNDFSQDKATIGSDVGTGEGWDGFISNVRLIKGTALYTSNFTPPSAPLTNVTNTKLLCCQSNTSAIEGAVKPGTITAAGNAAATTFNPFTTDINTVRGQETGYCTLNPLSTATAILTNGNLMYEGGSGQHTVSSTLSVSSGKWYWESFVEPGGNYYYCGIADVSTNYSGNWCGSNSGWSVSVNSAGNICYNNAENLGSIGVSIGGGQTWGWALDMDAGTFKVYVDGIIRYSGNSIIPGATSLSGRTVTPATGHNDGKDLTFNFGQKPFKFPPPAGFQSLNAASVRPETVIARPDQYFGLNLWTGNGQSSLVVGGGDYIITPTTKDNGSYANREPYDMFDGSTSTYWQAAASGDRYQLMTFPTPKTGSKIELSVLASNGWDGFEINGTVPGNLPSTGSQSWYDITSHTGGSLSSIRIAYTSGNDTQLVYALRIDDTIVTNQVLGTDPYQFSPDLVWVKSRDATHFQSWIDTIRGGTKIIFSNTNAAEETQSGAITSFNSNGFSVSNWGAVNTNINSYVAWAWKAGGSKGTWNKDDVAYASAAAAGLTGITSPATLTAASIGTKQGFSIIRWNRGADHPSWSTGVIPHGLTQAPDLIITKNLASNRGWMVFHSGKGTGRLYLDQTGTGDGSGYTTLPTATHFTIDSTSDANTASDCMSYCWHNVPGLQKFGKYTGNEDADGPFIELGFRPSVIIIKRSDGGTENWTLWDASRNPENIVGKQLYPNLTAAESDAGTNASYGILDFVSNGVKLRGSHTSYNSDGGTFIYMAWAEAPEFNLYGAQSNAF